jgi:transposase
MIDYELFCKIRHLKEQEGLNAHQIAADLAMDPRTVTKWLTRERFCQRKASVRSSKLDPFKNEILRMLQTHAFTAAQILMRIRGQGFAGGYSIVKDFVRGIRPPKSPTYLTLAFAPGECAQVDWGSYGYRRQHPPASELLCDGALLQPHALLRVHRQPEHGALPLLP